MMVVWPTGTWVEIEMVILGPGMRAPQVPPDTQATPLVMRATGFLAQSATVGEAAEIKTVIGRSLSGRLTKINPRALPDFGRPIPELLTVGQELRQHLEEYQDGH